MAANMVEKTNSFSIRIVYYGLIVLAGVFLTNPLLVSQAHAGFVATRSLINNGGFETDESWLPYQDGFSYVSGSHSGARSIRLDNTTTSGRSGAYQRVDLNQTEKLPVTLRGFMKGRDIVNAPGGYFGASLYVEIHMNDGSVAYWNSALNTGTFGWREVGISIGSLPSVDKPIDHIYVVPILADASGRAWFDDIQLTEYQGDGAAVTFMFDDGEASTLVAKEILDEKGFLASAPIPSAYVGAEGYMTKEEIQGLYDDGWEIMGHGINHDDLTQFDASGLRRELRQPVNYFRRQLGIEIKNVAYPYGAYNGEVSYQTSRYYKSGRAYEIGLNGAGSWPYDVKVKSLEENTTAAEVGGWISQAQAENMWVVLVGHKISETGDDKYFVTPTQFGEIVEAVSSSGAQVVTYDQGLDMFTTN